jgi:hypothetical protein
VRLLGLLHLRVEAEAVALAVMGQEVLEVKVERPNVPPAQSDHHTMRKVKYFPYLSVVQYQCVELPVTFV